MILIPPTHGRGAARLRVPAAEIVDRGEGVFRAEVLNSLNRIFREEFGVDAPESWIQWEAVDSPWSDDTEIRVEAIAPTTANVVRVPGGTRAFVIPVTTESRIPIVNKPHRIVDGDAYLRADHALTFKGWDAETGLMVFDR